ncbi:MAG: hypothetical protein KatS3mg052_1539 [Candidatus Roseilinea sp.]|nr:MAG: hypothetical protein KatS3mg052_1539 [Candidatus Roseilinea sp.]
MAEPLRQHGRGNMHEEEDHRAARMSEGCRWASRTRKHVRLARRMPPKLHPGQRGLTLVLASLGLLVCAACADNAPSRTSKPARSTAPPAQPTIYATRPARTTATPAPLAHAAATTPDIAALTTGAHYAAFTGDYARAIELGQQAVAASGSELRRDALRMRLNIGRWQMDAGQADAAVATLSSVVADLSANGADSGAELPGAQALLGRGLRLVRRRRQRLGAIRRGAGRRRSHLALAARLAGRRTSGRAPTDRSDPALPRQASTLRRLLLRNSPAARNWRWPAN